ncbi:MAG: heavy-metal-associated domain-containing protein [Chloroflexota bacterium]|mgnify:CR=1 FL=1|nr:MAG: heavy metal transporter [Chloroflexota bacterium]
MKEVKTFRVPNIGCDGCVRTIQNELAEIPGVTKVIADRDTKTVVVEWEPPADWPQIEAKLREIDYAPDVV